MNHRNLTTAVNEPSDTTSRRDDYREPPLPESFHLLVTCRNEVEQRRLYKHLTANGHDCRVLSL